MSECVAEKKRRVLWIINHQTLMDFEPYILRDLGYEVYIPKLFPQSEENRSGKVTYDFDSSLTIPREVLDQLNEFNFYRTKITPTIRSSINNYFDIAIIAAFPHLVEQFITAFEGRIILRVFGHASNTYAKIFEDRYPGFKQAVINLGDRFFFGTAFQHLEDIEPDYIRSRPLYLPIGLPQVFFAQKNTWIGDEDFIIFVCPVINSSPYYQNIYRNFTRFFKGFDYKIGGKQLVQVDDPAVIGSLTREEIDSYLRHCRVMFYHSEEPYHLHHHPLEAMAFGVPVIFMKKGLLGRLGQELPGASKNYREARQKVERVILGDQEFIKNIQKSQYRILENFSYEYCIRRWRESFATLIKERQGVKQKRKHKIALFVPGSYKSGTFDAARAIAKIIHEKSKNSGSPVHVVLSVQAGVHGYETIKKIKEEGIDLRETKWEIVDRDRAKKIANLTGILSEMRHSHYYVPRDFVDDFMDCDLWICVSDSFMYPIFPLKRYGVVVHDVLMKYFPEYQQGPLYYSRILQNRGADFILTTTPQTRDDVISYYGIASDRVFLVPIDYSNEDRYLSTQVPTSPYILWPTNAAVHKNHLNAFKALMRYYSLGGTYKIVITGWDVNVFDLSYNCPEDQLLSLPHIAETRRYLEREKSARDKIEIRSNLEKQECYDILKRAAFLFCPTMIDNGTFAVIDAGLYKVPMCCSDYPQMRYLDETFNLKISFFNPRSPDEMAEKMLEMEQTWDKRKMNLPSQQELIAKIERKRDEYWDIMQGLL